MFKKMFLGNIKYSIKFYQSLHHSFYLAEEGEIREKEETESWSVFLGIFCTQQKAEKKKIKMNELLKISLFTVYLVVLPENVNHGTVLKT